jgi:hypothetical protein
MPCGSTRKQIDKCLSDAQQSLPVEITQHLGECELCQQYAQSHLLTHSLQAIGRPEIPSGLQQRIIANAHAQKNKPSIGRYWFRFSAAAVLVISLSLNFMQNVPVRETISSDESMRVAQVLSNIQLEVGEVQNTKIRLSSPQQIKQAAMTIKLPTHLAISGYDGIKQLNWLTNLKQGNNLMVLPIQLLEPLDGIIQVEVEHQGVKKAFIINVKALEPTINAPETI